MQSLADFQQRLASAILSRGPPPAGGFETPGFAVYRNTWLSALLDALDASYPTVAMLLGPELFKAVALEYVRSNPASSPVLAGYGEGFPDFLGEQPVGRELAYLGDVARLERLWTESYFASDAPALASEAASALSPENLLSLRAPLHPAARIGRFKTPAVTIWHAHRGADQFDQLEPEWRPEQALIVRRGSAVEVRPTDVATCAFLEELQQGASFGAAADSVAQRFGDADITGTFAAILSSGALVLPTHLAKG